MSCIKFSDKVAFSQYFMWIQFSCTATKSGYIGVSYHISIFC